MDNEDLIRQEAFRIYEWRMQWTPCWPGDDKTDWEEAEDNIQEERMQRLGIHNRLERYNGNTIL